MPTTSRTARQSSGILLKCFAVLGLRLVVAMTLTIHISKKDVVRAESGSILSNRENASQPPLIGLDRPVESIGSVGLLLSHTSPPEPQERILPRRQRTGREVPDRYRTRFQSSCETFRALVVIARGIGLPGVVQCSRRGDDSPRSRNNRDGMR